jgi:hypothetical protein
MSAENPSKRPVQNPEQQEWQGQKWEYLAASVFPNRIHIDSPNLLAKQYNEKVGKKKTSVADDLNILGSDGWEVITWVDDPRRGLLTDSTFLLILKRPVPSSE